MNECSAEQINNKHTCNVIKDIGLEKAPFISRCMTDSARNQERLFLFCFHEDISSEFFNRSHKVPIISILIFKTRSIYICKISSRNGQIRISKTCEGIIVKPTFNISTGNITFKINDILSKTAKKPYIFYQQIFSIEFSID